MEWRKIDGYPNYMISESGQVRSFGIKPGIRKEKIIKNFSDKHGYVYVALCKDGAPKRFKISRLLALAFIPNNDPANKFLVRHLDDNPRNNALSNLAWGTRMDNSMDADGNLRRGDVERARKILDDLKTMTIGAAAEKNGMGYRTISSIRSGKSFKGIERNGKMFDRNYEIRRYTEDQVVEMYRLFKIGWGTIRVARKFDIDNDRMRDIKFGRKYKDWYAKYH